jgi:hypothetical protein
VEPVESILEEYRTADAGYRLDLFLAYRDLREGFTSIDADGLRASRTTQRANDDNCEGRSGAAPAIHGSRGTWPSMAIGVPHAVPPGIVAGGVPQQREARTGAASGAK